MMTALTIDQVLALRKDLQERFGVYVHMHDACGAQSFSVEPDEMTDALREYLQQYFSGMGMTVQISDDGYFAVR